MREFDVEVNGDGHHVIWEMNSYIYADILAATLHLPAIALCVINGMWVGAVLLLTSIAALSFRKDASSYFITLWWMGMCFSHPSLQMIILYVFMFFVGILTVFMRKE